MDIKEALEKLTKYNDWLRDSKNNPMPTEIMLELDVVNDTVLQWHKDNEIVGKTCENCKFKDFEISENPCSDCGGWQIGYPNNWQPREEPVTELGKPHTLVSGIANFDALENGSLVDLKNVSITIKEGNSATVLNTGKEEEKI